MLTTTKIFTDFKTHVGDSVVEQTEFIRLLNKLLIEMGITKPAEQVSKIYYCHGWEKYPSPTDMRAPIALTNSNRLFMKYFSPMMFRLKNHYRRWTEQSDNGVRYFLINYTGSASQKTIVTECDSLTADGTWSISGGSSLAVNSTEKKSGSGSIGFKVSGTQCILTFIRTNVIDISGFTEQLRQRLYLKTPTAPSSVKLRIGNDASNYLEQTVTAQVSGEPFATDEFNELEIDKPSATETGSVDLENMDWFEIELNFSSSVSQSGFLVDKIELFKPDVLDLEYYTSYVAIDSDGALTETITETSGTPTEDPIVKNYPNYLPTILDGLGYYWFINRGTPDLRESYRRDYLAKRDPRTGELISGISFLAKKYPDRSATYRRAKRLPDINTGYANNRYYTE